MTELQGFERAGENGGDPGGEQKTRGDTFLEIDPHGRVLNEKVELVNSERNEGGARGFAERRRRLCSDRRSALVS